MHRLTLLQLQQMLNVLTKNQRQPVRGRRTGDSVIRIPDGLTKIVKKPVVFVVAMTLPTGRMWMEITATFTDSFVEMANQRLFGCEKMFCLLNISAGPKIIAVVVENQMREENEVNGAIKESKSTGPLERI